MGTTKDALNAGSVTYKYVVAIEGYKYLLTNATPAQATTAWSGTGYTQALGGLFVDLKTGQSIQPWKAFSTSKTLQFHVRDQDGTDTFGIDTANRNSGGESELAATVDRDDTTIPVVYTGTFVSAGEAYIGTECFGYSGITATTFTGCTRGKYSPFPVTGTSFGQFHRVVAPSGISPKLQPIVSQKPRVWLGKWCGVWIHRYVNGVLDTKAEAHLVFAGRIVDIQDGANLATSVTVQHVLDVINDTTIFRDGWSAKVKPGIRLDLWQRFTMVESIGATVEIANPLQVVAGAPASVNEIQEGFYTHDELYDALNTWLSAELAASRLYSAFWMWEAPTSQYPTPHTKIYWERSTSAAADPSFSFGMPDEVLSAFGFNADDTDNGLSYINRVRAGSSTPQHIVAQNPPVRSVFTQTLASTIQLELAEEHGTFIDQYDFVPASDAVFHQNGLEWGYFLIDSQFLIRGAKVGAELQYCLNPLFRWAGSADSVRLLDYAIPEGREFVEIRQILILEDSLSNILKYFFYSSGNPGYNHATWDEFDGFGLGLGIPAPLLGDDFLQSLDRLPGAHAPQLAVIDRAKKFVDVFNGDLVFRRAFLRWKDGGLQFRTWITPTAGDSVATLTEANKAAPVGDGDNHRATTVETDEWQFPIVKLKYNRDVKDLSNTDGFRSTLTLQDGVAIDDAGGAGKTLTISASNTYDDESGSGVLKALLADFLASFPLHSRPAHTTARTIGQRHFEQLAVGDVVTITDSYARDPDTGRRGVQARPAFITKTDVDYGGSAADADESRVAGGEVQLFMLPANRAATYVPCGDIDDTATGGGFSAGYSSVQRKLRILEHRYSIASDTADVNRFAVNDVIRIVEKDPANPAAPTMWERTVTLVSGNDLTIDSVLAAPAWDATKKYRVMFAHYSSCQASQQVHCFQADDADGLIDASVAPREYSVGQGNAPSGTAAAAVTDEVELPPENTYANGEPRDVGTDLALARLLNNLIDFKTANHSPQLNAVMSGSGGVWNLVSVEPHFVTLEQLGIITRSAVAAVFLRSTNGVDAYVRVSLVRDMPSEDTLEDIERGLVYSEATFSSASTVWATSADAELNLAVKSETGFLYILIEVTSNAETRGLAKFVEGEREGFAVIGV